MAVLTSGLSVWLRRIEFVVAFVKLVELWPGFAERSRRKKNQDEGGSKAKNWILDKTELARNHRPGERRWIMNWILGELPIFPGKQ
jgi:hypothetical protein